MIFAHSWHKVLQRRKTRTTRLKLPPGLHVGAIRSVQPGRGKPALGHIRIRAISLQAPIDFSPRQIEREGIPRGKGQKKAWHQACDLVGLPWRMPCYALDFELVESYVMEMID